jgi:hypothetical protein
MRNVSAGLEGFPLLRVRVTLLAIVAILQLLRQGSWCTAFLVLGAGSPKAVELLLRKNEPNQHFGQFINMKKNYREI